MVALETQAFRDEAETPNTVPELVFQQARRGSRRPAWFSRSGINTWVSMDWATYGEQVRQAAAGLAVCGLRHGDRIAIMAPSSLKWELLEKAALTLGAVVVGIDPHAPLEQRAFIAHHAGVSVVATTTGAALSELPSDVRSQLRCGIVWHRDEGAARDARLVSWEDLLRTDGDHLTLRQPRSDDPAILIYTSG